MTRITRLDLPLSPDLERELVIGYSGPKDFAYTGAFRLRVNRWNALLGKQRIIDPFTIQTQPPFYLKPSAFLRYAQSKAPAAPQPTVSDFAGWVYSLYAPSQKPQALRYAREREPDIFDVRPDYWLDKFMVEAPSTIWKLAYNGLHMDRGPKLPLTYFDIPSLRVNGEALRGSPDLVYTNADLQAAFIVEIKFSRRPIPSNLWPNVWAQLWAYSKIPSFNSFPKLDVVAEVWGETPHYNSSLSERLYLRKTTRRNPRAASFERFFAALFSIYSHSPYPLQNERSACTSCEHSR